MRKLTLKQQGFVKDYLETKNASEAVRRNYDLEGKAQSLPAAIASENLTKPNIQAAIKQMQQLYVEDSFLAYKIQKDILHKTKDDEKHYELANKIADKIQDRAGFMPVAKTENKSITARYTITRGSIDKPAQELSPL